MTKPEKEKEWKILLFIRRDNYFTIQIQYEIL